MKGGASPSVFAPLLLGYDAVCSFYHNDFECHASQAAAGIGNALSRVVIGRLTLTVCIP